MNGGTCSRIGNSEKFQCQCPPAWKGLVCQNPNCEPACGCGGTCVGKDLCAYPANYTCYLPLVCNAD